MHVFYFSKQTRLSWFEGSIENLFVIRCHDVMLRTFGAFVNIRPKKTQLLLKTEVLFFSPWFSPGCPKEKGIKTRIFGCFYGWFVLNSYLLRVSCHHMFLAFSCYFVFIKGLNSYSVLWGIFFGITTRMLKKVWIIYLH